MEWCGMVFYGMVRDGVVWLYGIFGVFCRSQCLIFAGAFFLFFLVLSPPPSGRLHIQKSRFTSLRMSIPMAMRSPMSRQRWSACVGYYDGSSYSLSSSEQACQFTVWQWSGLDSPGALRLRTVRRGRLPPWHRDGPPRPDSCVVMGGQEHNLPNPQGCF